MARASASAVRDASASGRNEKTRNAARRLWIAGPRGRVMRLSLRFEAPPAKLSGRPARVMRKRRQFSWAKRVIDGERSTPGVECEGEGEYSRNLPPARPPDAQSRSHFCR